MLVMILSRKSVSVFCYTFMFYCRYESVYAKRVPEAMLGETFVEEFIDHNDSVTVIDNKRKYVVRAPAKHPIYENFRVKVSEPVYWDIGIV